MLSDKGVAVVVPAKNEETQISRVLETMPDFVDAIFVIDDGSTDGTAKQVEDWARRDSRVQLIRHAKSRGVGGAIASGYAAARDQQYDVTAVMAGDGQMDPDDLETVVFPVAADLADYCKGNRFQWAQGLQRIPSHRLFGNFALSILTKIVSGYWHVSDTQTGYTAISLAALRSIDVENIYPVYGCPNDILIKLNVAEMRVAEVPVNPVYHVGERSKMRIQRVILPILTLLIRGFFGRLFNKYLIRSGHPLVFSYLLAFFFLQAALGIGIYVIVQRILTGMIMRAALICASISMVLGFQFVLAAFQMDFQSNSHLLVHLRPELRFRWHNARKGETTLKETRKAA